MSPVTYRRVTGTALVLLIAIVVTGGAVRLTGSGLGCPEWPTCEGGSLVAPMRFHAWVEYGNRLFTGVVSLSVMAAVLGSLFRKPRRRDLVRWSLGLVAGLLAQILLGAVVVVTHLTPLAVTGHFLLSMLLVWNAAVLHEKSGIPDGGGERAQLVPPSPAGSAHTQPHSSPSASCSSSSTPPGPVPAVLQDLVTATLAWAPVVLVTGTLVTSAGPHSGDPGRVERLDLPLEVVARIHGLTVVVFLALALVVAVMSNRRTPAHVISRRSRTLLWIAVAQAAVGWTQYFTGVPALLVGVHLLGATLVWLATVRLHLAASTHSRSLHPAAVRVSSTRRDMGGVISSSVGAKSTS